TSTRKPETEISASEANPETRNRKPETNVAPARRLATPPPQLPLFHLAQLHSLPVRVTRFGLVAGKLIGLAEIIVGFFHECFARNRAGEESDRIVVLASFKMIQSFVAVGPGVVRVAHNALIYIFQCLVEVAFEEMDIPAVVERIGRVAFE